jgi:hypothetical protein
MFAVLIHDPGGNAWEFWSTGAMLGHLSTADVIGDVAQLQPGQYVIEWHRIAGNQ